MSEQETQKRGGGGAGGAAATTPVMRQYLRLKEEAGDAILFFRMGDFYEMFFEDAVVAAEICDLTLTSRNKQDPDPIPMAGVPWHSAEPHLTKLLRAGHRVAICEQVEEAGRKLLERRIVEILSPGTALAESLLDARSNNYLCAIAPGRAQWGLALADISTGELRLGEMTADDLLAELARRAPREVLIPSGSAEDPLVSELARQQEDLFRTRRDDWHFSARRGRDQLRELFGVASLEGFGVADCEAALAAVAALLAYATEQQRTRLAHLRPPRRLRPDDALLLDATTLRNLEVLAPVSGRGRHCLLGVLDETRTAAGGRAVRRALQRPLRDRARIAARHDAVEAFTEDPALLERLRERLRRVTDLERLLARLHCGRGGPRDLARVRETLRVFPELQRDLSALFEAGRLCVGRDCEPQTGLRALLERALVEEPAPTREGDVIRSGYDAELDDQRSYAAEGVDWIARLQEREREATGIPSLKVGHNKVFGYYLEVTRAHLDRVPEEYERRQTLVGGERFVTPELKTWEAKVAGAQERVFARQATLIESLTRAVTARTSALQRIADALAEWDLLASFAQAARRGNYVRPALDEGDRIQIEEGRHPVVERFLEGEAFVPNDLEVDGREAQILVITGPNMAGKSTFLRQVGLLVLMAQAGSFVPASRARIGLADRIFTRVGASDDIARGRSTFLVEMIETSRILHEATSRSLVLLDEIGRGTSTFDGLAIAWAVAERLRENPVRRPRTLFATHFHELTALARERRGYRNLNVLVKEWQERVIFVRRVAPGAADRSYGIAVARLAGLPESVLLRAREILAELERHGPLRIDGVVGATDAQSQLPLFAAPAPAPAPATGQVAILREALADLDPDALSPREALDWLYALRRRLAREDDRAAEAADRASKAADRASEAKDPEAVLEDRPGEADDRAGEAEEARGTAD
ncbi:MAG: DNA mismatch repair protein MutS [Candidatus Eisenbacteria bacterium]|nr:DNA mismatch repair protein MutS [Candidatus Eisenbacteria bacterium]